MKKGYAQSHIQRPSSMGHQLPLSTHLAQNRDPGHQLLTVTCCDCAAYLRVLAPQGIFLLISLGMPKARAKLLELGGMQAKDIEVSRGGGVGVQGIWTM